MLNVLVNPPQTTSKIQRHCAKALIEAACHIFEARPLALLTAKIKVLITYPNMFGSEIYIFFDSDYFNSFFDRDRQIAKNRVTLTFNSHQTQLLHNSIQKIVSSKIKLAFSA